MARNDESTRALLPAIIVGVAIIMGAWAIKSSLDRNAENLDSIRLALADTKGALQQVAQARPAGGGGAGARPGRPDPAKRYTVNTAGAPAKGPASAKVKIVEFSDFQ